MTHVATLVTERQVTPVDRIADSAVHGRPHHHHTRSVVQHSNLRRRRRLYRINDEITVDIVV